MNRLKIAQLNCRSINKHKLEIENLLAKHNITIVCFNETKTKRLPKLKDFNMAAAICDSVTGSAIYIKDNIQYQVLDQEQHTNNNHRVCRKVCETIKVKVLGITVTSVYLSPDAEIENVILNDNDPKHIIVGDFNAQIKSVNPKARKTDCNGRVVDALMHSYFLLNGSEPTHQSNSILDLHFASPKMACLCTNFEVSDTTPSDHYMTITEYELTVPKRICMKPNWRKFRGTVTNYKFNPDSIKTDEGLAQEADRIAKHIDKCYQGSLKENKHPYTSPQLIELVKDKHRLERQKQKMRRNDQQETNEYKDLCSRLNKIKKDIRQHKQIVEEERQLKLLSDMNKGPVHQNFWKAVQTLTGTKPKRTSKLKMTNQDAANHFAKMLKANMTTNKTSSQEALDHEQVVHDKVFHARIQDFQLEQTGYAQTDFSLKRLKDVIKQRKNTAPGHDKVSYKAMKNLPDNILEVLRQIILQSLRSGYVPLGWKQATVSMLPKPEKDHRDPKNYRPLSLTSCIGKICECFVKQSLLGHCEEHDVFGNFQSAYRSERCTTDNLLCLTETIFNDNNWNQPVAAAFLDVKRAFDSVWHEGLYYRLLEIDCPKWIIKWTKNFLSDRELTVVYHQATADVFTPSAGVPQGSVISPILFNIYVSKPDTGTSNVSQYADDIGLYTSANTCKNATHRLQGGLDKLDAWCRKWKIDVNPDKTNFVLFTRRKKDDCKLTLQGEEIRPTSSTRFLGLSLSDKLTWTDYLQRIENKSTRKVNFLLILRAKGIRPKVLQFLYRTTILPVSTYASPAWANATTKKIQLIQNRALKIAHNLPRLTPTDELHDYAKMKTVKQELTRLNKNYLKRAAQNNPKIRELVEDSLKQATDSYHHRLTPIQAIFQQYLEGAM